jgi:dephospho-CoA kinase
MFLGELTMLNFREFIFESAYDELNEALITLGGKPYPKFNNIVIMAGGAGSGKGFVLGKLIGVEGKVFDVDALKTLSMKTPSIIKKAEKEFGVNISNMDLKNSENVSKLHEIISELGIDDKHLKNMYTSIIAADNNRKPNIIFDCTLKDLRKLEKLSTAVTELGYDKKDIHIVWVVNDIEIAKQQNLSRDRTVPEEILVNTHRGVSQTMGDVINLGARLGKYMDGDIVFAFNAFKIDADLVKSSNPAFTDKKGKERRGEYVKKANYVYVKRKGQQVTSQADLSDDIKAKIRAYTPKGIDWS